MNLLKETRGVVFVIVLIYIALTTLLLAGYMNMMSSEYRITKTTNDATRAIYEAEAGAQRGVAEIIQRVRTDLDNRIQSLSNSAILTSYVATNNSLAFLQDYAYATGAPQFSVSGGTATLNIPAQSGFSYTGPITITANGAPSNPGSDVYTFPYNYTTRASVPISAGNKIITLTGTFTVTVVRQNFARYALFTNQQRTASGTTVWFTNSTNFSGPVHTNGRFNFALNPSGTFTGAVTQVQPTAQFYNNGWPILLNANSNGARDVPTFQAGFTRSSGAITMPTVTDRDTQRRRALGLSDGQSIPGYTNGIYLPNNAGAVSGGIYIQGNSTVALSQSGNNAIYTITEGTTTKNITVDYTNNQTTVQTVGGSSTTYNGKLNGMIFNNGGSINSLSGTVEGNSQVTIAATSDILISNHIRYENYTSGNPPNATGATNVLGIVAWDGGNVRIPTTAPNDIEIHATIMAPSGEFKVDNHNTGSPRGTATLLGGVITNTYGAFGTFGDSPTGYGRNFVYDTRMASGTSPPFFPTLSNFDSNENGLANRPGWSGGN